MFCLIVLKCIIMNGFATMFNPSAFGAKPRKFLAGRVAMLKRDQMLGKKALIKITKSPEKLQS